MPVFIAAFEILQIKGAILVVGLIYLICKAIKEKAEISKIESRYPGLGIKEHYRYDVREQRKNHLIFWASFLFLWLCFITMICLEGNKTINIGIRFLIGYCIGAFAVSLILLRKTLKKYKVIDERISLLQRGIIPKDATAYEKIKIQYANEHYPDNNILLHYRAEKRSQRWNRLICFCYFFLILAFTTLLLCLLHTAPTYLLLLILLAGIIVCNYVRQKAQQINKNIQDRIIRLQHGDIPNETDKTQSDILKVKPLIASIILFTIFTGGWFGYQYKKEQITLELIRAIKNNDIAQVQDSLSSLFADVNAKDETEATPLHIAVKQGRTEIVKTLLAAPDIDINAKDAAEETPLHIAVKHNHAEIIKVLLAAPGIDVNAKSEAKAPPLHMAVKQGKTEIVKALLATPGINVNEKDAAKETPLHIAVKHNHTEIVKALLAAPGINVNEIDKVGRTPIDIDCNYKIWNLLRNAGGKHTSSR